MGHIDVETASLCFLELNFFFIMCRNLNLKWSQGPLVEGSAINLDVAGGDRTFRI